MHTTPANTHPYLSRIRGMLGTQLYKNSFFMIMNKMLGAGSGFIFWYLAAHFYSVGDVGMATALISAAGTVLQFSYLGFDYSVIRFFSKYDRTKMYNTFLILATSIGLTLGVIYIVFVRQFSPELAFIQTPVYGAIFLLYIGFSVLGQTAAVTFIAARKAEMNFLQYLLLTVRLPLLIPLAFLGSIGILTSIGLAYAIVSLIILYLVSRLVSLRPQVDPEFVRMSLKFSSGNYFAQILLNITYLLLPIIILNMLGSDAAAKYYIAYTIGNFLLQVPDAVGMSLFVEGSHGESMRKNVIRAAAGIYAVLIPGIIFFYIFGGQILGIFGKDYVESVQLLRIFAFTSLFFAIYCLIVPVLNVRMNVRRVIQLNALICVLFMSMSIVFLQWFGITGAGLALMGTFIVMDVIIVALALKEGMI